MASGIVIRQAGTADVDTLLAQVQSGLNSFSSFTPPGWQAPDAHTGRRRALVLLGDPGTFALIAEADGSPVGHVAFHPARELVPGDPPEDPLEPPLIPGLAHFWQLFVLPAWWGRGVAPELHEAAAAEMRGRGYTSARLFTPSLQARARRFYERHGWEPGSEHWSARLQLMMVEYRLAVAGPAAPSAS